MTSTISSKNKNFAKLYKWAFARNKAMMIVFSVIMAVGLAIDVYILMQTVTPRMEEDVLVKSLGILGYLSIAIAQVGATIFSYISALHTFSFLHNKRSTDMYGAIPSTRSTLYFSHILGGMTAVAIPFVVGCFGVVGITCRSLNYFFMQIAFILFGLIGIVAVYSFTALICYCCGTVRDSAIISFAANIIYIGVVGIFWGIAASMIPGVSFDYILYAPTITLFAPMGFCFFLDAYLVGYQSAAFWTTIIWSILFTAGIIFVGNSAAKTRKAETAQNDFNVKWLPVVIKVGISVLAGSFAGVITSSSLNSGFLNMFTFTFWYIVIGFASFFILHLIFSRGVKGKFIPSFIAYLCTTVAAVGLLFAMTTGLGIDTYVPDASTVSGVQFGTSRYTYTDPENIKTITEIHKVIVDGIQQEYPRPYYIGHSRDDGHIYYYDYDSDEYNKFYAKYPLTSREYFYFSYDKKLGFKTDRNYYISFPYFNSYDCDKMEQLLRTLYNSEEYKKNSNEDLWSEEGAKRNGKLPSSAKINYFNFGSSSDYDEWSGKTYTTYGYINEDQLSIKTDEKFISGLYDALKKDILADKNYYLRRYIEISDSFYYDSIENENAVLGKGYMLLTVHYPGSTNEFQPSVYSYSISDYIYEKNLSIVIKEDYTNTLRYLEDNGIKTIADLSA